MILGDGSYVVTLAKRGYVKAGDWTPEAAVEVTLLSGPNVIVSRN